MTHTIAKFLAVSVALSVSSSSYAASASGITQMWIVADTSEVYNPVLPNPLTSTTAIEQMNWDVVPYGQFASNRTNAGTWIAFVVATFGYYVDGSLSAKYKGLPATYFGPTYDLVDSTGLKYGSLDIFYCTCTARGLSEAFATSITGGAFYNRLYIN